MNRWWGNHSNIEKVIVLEIENVINEDFLGDCELPETGTPTSHDKVLSNTLATKWSGKSTDLKHFVC